MYRHIIIPYIGKKEKTGLRPAFPFRLSARVPSRKHAFQHRAAVFILCMFPCCIRVQRGIRGQVVDAAAASPVRVRRAEHAPSETAHDQGAGAHGARFQRHIEGTVVQPPVPLFFPSAAQTEDLRVGGRIMSLFPAVVVRPQQGIPPVQRRADGDFPLRARFFRLPERCFHPGPVPCVHTFFPPRFCVHYCRRNVKSQSSPALPRRPDSALDRIVFLLYCIQSTGKVP